MIEKAGGNYVARPRAETNLLIVGQGGPPLGEDGRLTHSLRKAQELQEAGKGPRILAEDEFLARLGLLEHSDGLHQEFSTAQLARILNSPPSLVRLQVHQGLLRPAREVARLYFFTFPQVSTAKTIMDLLLSGVTPGRIRRSLEMLRDRMPEAERILGHIEVPEFAGPLLVRTDDGGLAEPNGQRRFQFEDARRDLRLASSPEQRSLVEWFELGVRAERDGRIEDAVRAYCSALHHEPNQPELRFSLASALYGMGRFDESRAEFERTVELAPDHAEAWNNLGILLGDLDETKEAVSAYRRALCLHPEYPDALYNLAEALHKRGEEQEARNLWRRYLHVDPTSPFARLVRQRLGET